MEFHPERSDKISENILGFIFDQAEVFFVFNNNKSILLSSGVCIMLIMTENSLTKQVMLTRGPIQDS